jgi:hypothetical protein
MSCRQTHWTVAVALPDASQLPMQVTTPGNPVAASFLYSEGLRLQALAAAQRPDLDVQVHRSIRYHSTIGAHSFKGVWMAVNQHLAA